ncbi:MAG: hypothetical protein KIS67_07380 [Verrucomicrobiae bacterium]|nr:hypothetical protein [Verrucomicrobiae bacterium]
MRRMALSLLLLFLVVSVVAEEGLNQVTTNHLRVASISLTDQHGRQRMFGFPQPGVSVLTVADQKGSEQIAGWVQPLRARFPESLPIEGVADVSQAPRVLRPLLRKRFAASLDHPVMLDWEGTIARQLDCQPGVANIFLLSTNGAVLLAFCGTANDERLQKLQDVVLAANKSGTASTNAQAQSSIRGRDR